MKKEDYISYWSLESKKDFGRAQLHFETKDYLFALFCAHLCLEKILKAHWVKSNKENVPPRIHNLVFLADQAKLTFTNEQRAFLETMNVFQLEGRYPDYQYTVSKTLKSKNTLQLLEQTKTFRTWLQKML